MYIILLKENCCDGTAHLQKIAMHVNIVSISAVYGFATIVQGWKRVEEWLEGIQR